MSEVHAQQGADVLPAQAMPLAGEGPDAAEK